MAEPWAAAPSANENATATTPTNSAATVLAHATRVRRASRVKVTSAVRWDHSDVTAMIPTTGSRIAIGMVVAWR